MELLALPPAARAQRAARLLASLDETEDPDAEEAWAQEAERRLQEVNEGKAITEPAEEVMREACQRFP